MKTTQMKSAIARITGACAGVVLAALLCVTSCKKPDVLPSSVSVTPSSATITEGETANFSATVLPAEAVYSGISWSSSDTKVATVNNGVVTGVKAGSATITASADGVSGSATVTVIAKIIAVTGVSLDKAELALTEGEEAQLKATVAPDNATDKSVNWKSADEKVATVSSDGKVTAVAPGETTITVTTADGGKTASCKVTVNAKVYPVESVSLDKTELVLTEGGEEQLTATIAPENASNKKVTWKSSDTGVAKVSSGGKVTAVAPGIATITVTTEDGGKTATCTVTVLENIDGALPGVFSVSATKKVRFSKGNLQAFYHAGIYEFRFAANQYNYVGDAPGNTTIDSQQKVTYVDLFGWSTASTNYGISASTDVANYSGDFVDWGKNIGDGSTWRTLSTEEWEYLFKTRTNASSLYKKCVTVCGKTNCLIIAPDGFTGTIAASYDASTWPVAEAAGLVCLPAAGRRVGSDVYNVGDYGYYWSSSAYGSNDAYYVSFSSSSVSPGSGGLRYYGRSVRLITDVK